MKEVTFKENNGADVKYNLEENPIGEGSTGVVYRAKVTTKPNKEYAIKVSKISSEQFNAQANLLYRERIPHFINVEKVGVLSGFKDGKDIEAMVLQYGGSDLKTVILGLEDKSVDKNVIKAFQYKVLLTVVAGLQEAAKNGIQHLDLFPQNILCGFDISLYKESFTNGLEEKLINSEIYLCDRMAVEGLRTMAMNSSLTGADLMKWIVPFCYAGDKKEADVRAVVALWNMFNESNNNNIENSFVLAQKIAGKQLANNEYVTLEQIKKALENEISSDDQFITDVSYPCQVFRSVDIFKCQFSSKALLSKEDLTELVETSIYSFNSLQKKGKTSDDASKLEELLYSYLSNSMNQNLELYKKKLSACGPILTKQLEAELKCKELNVQLNTFKYEYTGSETVLKAAISSLINLVHQPKFNEQLNYLIDLIKSDDDIAKTFNFTEESVRTTNGQISLMNKQLKSSNYNYSLNMEALLYIKSLTKTNELSTEHKTEINTKLKDINE